MDLRQTSNIVKNNTGIKTNAQSSGPLHILVACHGKPHGHPGDGLGFICHLGDCVAQMCNGGGVAATGLLTNCHRAKKLLQVGLVFIWWFCVHFWGQVAFHFFCRIVLEDFDKYDETNYIHKL